MIMNGRNWSWFMAKFLRYAGETTETVETCIRVSGDLKHRPHECKSGELQLHEVA
jgi:hypothetical protein